MTNEKPRPEVAILPDHESAVRRMTADAHGTPYHPLRTLAEAQAAPDGVVIFEGDYGGQIYATCPASLVHCSEETLQALLRDLDTVGWCNLDVARIYYERRPVGAGVSGGMGGGRVTNDVWVHARIEAHGLHAPLRATLTATSQSYRSLYYELKPWPDVTVDGFVFGPIKQWDEASGHGFVIAPDGSRSGAFWHLLDSDALSRQRNPSEDTRRYYSDPEYFEERRSPDDLLWGIWNIAFPFPIPTADSEEQREAARRNLAAVLPKLRARWEAWRSAERRQPRAAERGERDDKPGR